MIKKNKIVIAMLILCNMLATSTYSIPQEDSAIASNKEPWNFEIYNKSGAPIWVSADHEGLLSGYVIKEKKLLDQQQIRTVVDLKKRIRIRIWNREPKLIGGPQPIIERGITTCQNLAPQERCTRQAFLTYDKYNNLRPQTGKLGGLPQKLGLEGVTESGLRITNNISALSIQEIRYK